uniref:Protein phosphatase 1 regulatory subunit 10 n=1 Tax=Sus scrofa TaxID=9823 RepID=A0ABB5UPH3_PIG
MGSGPIDPKELLKGLDSFLNRDGEVKSVDGISKIFSLMKEARKMVYRCWWLQASQQLADILEDNQQHSPLAANPAHLAAPTAHC